MGSGVEAVSTLSVLGEYPLSPPNLEPSSGKSVHST